MRKTIPLLLLSGMLAAATPSARQANSTLSFTDVTAQAGLADPVSGSHGACWADATGDGYPDLLVTYNDIRNGSRRNMFYRNNGNGTFTEEALSRGGIASEGKGTHGCSFADLDNDGDYDLLLGITHGETIDPLPNRLFRNGGTGNFTLATPPAMQAQSWPTRAILAPDLDSDGLADVFAVSGWLGSGDPPEERNELYRNAGNLQLTSDSGSPAVFAPMGQGGTDADFDNDGDVDLITCNMQGALNVMRNAGGILSAASAAALGFQHGCYAGITFGDVDNDGDQDAVMVHHAPARITHLYLNTGGGLFSYAGSAGGMAGFMAGLADLDNDGDLDVVIPGKGLVYLGIGNGGFTAGPAIPAMTENQDPRSVAFADYDSDGDLDMVITAKHDRPVLLRNNLNSGNWLKLRLASAQGQAGAFGAKVRAYSPGTANLLGMREARSNYGYLAQDDPVLHLGLGNQPAADVVVTFLDGREIRVDNAAANQTLVISGSGAPGVQPPGPPENLTAQVSGLNVSLSWNAPTAGDAPAAYVIEAGSSPNAANLAVFDTGGTGLSFAAQAPPGTYYVRVRGRNRAGIGPASNEAVVNVGGCDAPTGLAFSVASRSVQLSWTGTAGSYLVQAGSGPGLSDLAQAAVASTNPTFNSVPPGTYYVRVRGNGACGLTGPSNEVTIQVP